MSKMYSRNEEEWHVLEDIMHDLESDYSHGDEVDILAGDEEPFTHQEFINVDRIIENIQDCAFDEIGEWQQDYLDDLANDKEKMIELNKLLIDFITTNSKAPTCSKIVNVKEIKVIVGE